MIILDLKKKYTAPVVFVDYSQYGLPGSVLDCLQNLYAAQKYYKKEYRHCGRDLALYYARVCSVFKVSNIRLAEKYCDK